MKGYFKKIDILFIYENYYLLRRILKKEHNNARKQDI
jgi:hypothetical protein